jgi:thymidine kinase
MSRKKKATLNREFVIYAGPMWSGKSTRLLAAMERHLLRDSKIICFKPMMDERYATSAIVTHSGASIQAVPVRCGEQILEVTRKERPEVVAVDEAFMIEGSAQALIEIFMSGVSVYVSSIELSANLKTFREIEMIMPYATRVEKCSAVCVSCGDDAYLTNRKVKSDSEIAVGGSDSYEPMCWSCHPLVTCSN